MALFNTRFLLNVLPVLAGVLCFLVPVAAISQTPADGKYTERYENNRVKVQGRYEQGRKKGTWFYYAPDGKLQKRERWRNGTLKLLFSYNDSGKLVSITDANGRTTYKPACGCQ